MYNLSLGVGNVTSTLSAHVNATMLTKPSRRAQHGVPAIRRLPRGLRNVPGWVPASVTLSMFLRCHCDPNRGSIIRILGTTNHSHSLNILYLGFKLSCWLV